MAHLCILRCSLKSGGQAIRPKTFEPTEYDKQSTHTCVTTENL